MADDGTREAKALRKLQTEDLSALAEALRSSNQPLAVCRALERLSGETIGHRLFTVMQFDSDRSEVLRIHTSLPAVYPAGGRKKKKETRWADHVLTDLKVFRGGEPADIVSAFDDHATILGLGLGSVLNIPVVFKGRCVGTMNLLHQAGWYGPDDERIGLLLATFLTPVLLNSAPETD
ncbi:MAG: GAF domain-containing protein [Xanthobacteraceae bacterium]|nr:GAF domain-containing protein [Xanthobacteraceae bacterium]